MLRVLGEKPVRRLLGLSTQERDIILDRQTFIRVLNKEPGTHHVTFRSFHHAILRRVLQIHPETEILASPVHVQAMFMIKHRVQRFRQPIRVYPSFHVRQFRVVLVLQRVTIPLVIRFRVNLVKARQSFYFQFLGSIQQIVVTQIRHGNISHQIVRYIHLSRLGSHRGDNNHAIGSPGTIHGGCRSIFQYGDRLDTVRVIIVQLGYTDLEPVHDKRRKIRIIDQIRFRQRIPVELFRPRDSRLTPDIYLGNRIRV